MRYPHELEHHAEDRDAVQELVHQEGADSLPYERVIVWRLDRDDPPAPRASKRAGEHGQRDEDDEDHRLEDVDQLTRRPGLDLHLAGARRASPRTGCAAGMIANGLERASRATAIASKPTVVAKLVWVRWVTPSSSFGARHPAQARRHRHRQDDRAGAAACRRTGRHPGSTPAVRISKPSVVRYRSHQTTTTMTSAMRIPMWPVSPRKIGSAALPTS